MKKTRVFRRLVISLFLTAIISISASLIVIATPLNSNNNQSNANLYGKGIGLNNEFNPWPTPVNNPPGRRNYVDWYVPPTHQIILNTQTWDNRPSEHPMQYFDGQVDENRKVSVQSDGDGTVTIMFWEKTLINGGWVWLGGLDQTFVVSEDYSDIGWWFDTQVFSVWLVYNRFMDEYQVFIYFYTEDGHLNVISFDDYDSDGFWEGV